MSNVTAPGPIKSGRPRSEANKNKPKFWESALYALLVSKLPKSHMEGGRLNVNSVATAIGKHPFTVYKWLTSNWISPGGAKALIEESNGRLTAKDFAPFLIS